MEEQTKIAVGILGVVAVGGLLYAFKDKLIPNPEEQQQSQYETPAYTPNETPAQNYTPTGNDAFPLKKGSKGANVITLQTVLNSKTQPFFHV
jgi:hypothetical protein